jgi:hypothetical protein
LENNIMKVPESIQVAMQDAGGMVVAAVFAFGNADYGASSCPYSGHLLIPTVCAGESPMITPDKYQVVISEPSSIGTITLFPTIMEADEADNALIDSRRGEPTEPLEQVLAELGIG